MTSFKPFMVLPLRSEADQGVLDLKTNTSHGQLLRRNVERFRGGLVSKAHRLLYRSTLGWSVIKKRRRTRSMSAPLPWSFTATNITSAVSLRTPFTAVEQTTRTPVKARLWPWLVGKRPHNLSRCSPFSGKRRNRGGYLELQEQLTELLHVCTRKVTNPGGICTRGFSGSTTTTNFFVDSSWDPAPGLRLGFVPGG